MLDPSCVEAAMYGCRTVLGRGDAATQRENHEWPFAAFSCAHVLHSVYVGMCRLHAHNMYVVPCVSGLWDIVGCIVGCFLAVDVH